jgi:hypothetical protein
MDENLEQVTDRTADHGGKFVLAGGLTLANHQREIDQRWAANITECNCNKKFQTIGKKEKIL